MLVHLLSPEINPTWESMVEGTIKDWMDLAVDSEISDSNDIWSFRRKDVYRRVPPHSRQRDMKLKLPVNKLMRTKREDLKENLGA